MMDNKKKILDIFTPRCIKRARRRKCMEEMRDMFQQEARRIFNETQKQA